MGVTAKHAPETNGGDWWSKIWETSHLINERLLISGLKTSVSI